MRYIPALASIINEPACAGSRFAVTQRNYNISNFMFAIFDTRSQRDIHWSHLNCPDQWR